METPGVLAQQKKHFENSAQKLIDLAESSDWKPHTEKQGVHISRKETSTLTMMRGEARVKLPLQTIKDALIDPHRIKLWDEHCMLVDEVERDVDQRGTHSILYSQFRSPAPLLVSHRDFVTYNVFCSLPDGGIILAMESCGHPARPENFAKNFVRGELSHTGYVVRPINEDEVNIIYLAQLNPKGSVPSILVNQIATSQPLNIARMRDYLLKTNKQ